MNYRIRLTSTVPAGITTKPRHKDFMLLIKNCTRFLNTKDELIFDLHIPIAVQNSSLYCILECHSSRDIRSIKLRHIK